MTVRQWRRTAGRERGTALVALAAREFRSARSNAGLRQADVAAAAGISRPQYGRIERGTSPEVSLASVARIGAVLGLEASLRFFPSGDPLRDAAHAALLERFRTRLHRRLVWRPEVPFPRQGDLRAWDATISGFDASPDRPVRRIGVEAETRPTDLQALERKLALKKRDGDVDVLVLLLADTRHNRAFVAAHGQSLRSQLPLDGRRLLELLGAGVAPDRGAVVLV